MERTPCRVAVAVSVALLALTAPQAAHAAVTATFDPASGTLNVTGDAANDSITVTRDMTGTIVVTSGGGAVPVTGGTPTVTNTDAIDIDAGGGDDTVTIDAAIGPFAPGKTPTESTAVPEIEITADLGAGSDTLVFNGGGDETDLIGVGQIGGGSNGLSVNTDGDLDDVAESGAEQVQVNTAGGTDILNADGHSPSGFPFLGPYLGNLTANLGEGGDRADAGAGTNTINGEGGNDNVGLRFGTSIVDLGTGTNVGFAQVGGAVTIGQVGGATRVSAANVTGDFFNAAELLIDGSSGDDVIDAAGAAVVLDILTFGGNDIVMGGSGNDLVGGGEGNDNVQGGPGDDDIKGENGDDELRGDAGNDTANGGDGNDLCDAENENGCERDPPPTGGPGGTTPPQCHWDWAVTIRPASSTIRPDGVGTFDFDYNRLQFPTWTVTVTNVGECTSRETALFLAARDRRRAIVPYQGLLGGPCAVVESVSCPVPALEPGESFSQNVQVTDAYPHTGTAATRVDCDPPGEDGRCANNEVTVRYRLFFSARPGTATARPQRVPNQPASRLKQVTGSAAAGAGSRAKAVVVAAARRRGVRRVQIALVRRPDAADPKCRWLRNARARFRATEPFAGQCANPTWLNAKGTRRWVYRFRKTLPKGSYLLYARAFDARNRPQGTRSAVAFKLR